jgi:uracil-DNA glycosylase family 4
MGQLIDLSSRVSSCTACNLSLNCTNHVPGVGTYPADIMMVGESPGEIEDLVGRSFVGPAGQLLDSIIKAIG